MSVVKPAAGVDRPVRQSSRSLDELLPAHPTQGQQTGELARAGERPNDTSPVPAAMDPGELAAIGRELYGHPTRWQTRMARDLGVSVGTVANWAARRREVPGPAAVALRLLVSRQGQPISGFVSPDTAADLAVVAANGEAGAAAARLFEQEGERGARQGRLLKRALADLKLLQQRVTALEATSASAQAPTA